MFRDRHSSKGGTQDMNESNSKDMMVQKICNSFVVATSNPCYLVRVVMCGGCVRAFLICLFFFFFFITTIFR